ncbi:MAG: response regulator [Herbaspirillum huttiense]|uniref:response regulator n=1 Tax=Herbaspirillum huttiense TaxID=863372 RepID=UPI001AC8E31C|nr:response regulator [Herbaspirillum huttiense]MBN9356706.1 response regulator [Herbaspirillum huttiense]
MNLLFVEDDDDKAVRISEQIHKEFQTVTLVRSKSFDSALRNLVRNSKTIDGVILDMSMPNFDNSQEPPENFAGRDLLRQTKLRKIHKPTVVVTMLDLFGTPPAQLTLLELDQQLADEFAPSYLGIVYYSSAQESWKPALTDFIKKIQNYEDTDR